ncbi:MAG: hypothetical protein KatS3mg057_1141 [Herpetosiphonaceae bacterium]|nr:MAG: hypothetical protein KatS3mg057_1141 [Herpetosiphonaceae bacterium]
MPPAEAAGFTLLLGAIAGLNATLWIVPEQGPQSFGVALALAGLSALIFSLSLLPAWLGMAGTLMVLSRGAFDKSKAPSVAAASLFPGFLAAAAFLSGVARYVLTGLERPLALLQLGLLALAVIAIPVALYKELRREPALSDRISVLLGAATVVALLLGGLGVVLGSTVLGGIP